MQQDRNRTTQTSKDSGGSFALLEYEINRARSHLENNGESPVMRERLNKLEELLETCLHG